MKTKGVSIGEAGGYLVFPDRQVVPPVFWTRLKHEAAKAGRLEALAADYRAERERLEAERESGWQTVHDEYEAEMRLYRRWVVALVGEQHRWPWERGWTEAEVDAHPRRQEAP